MAILVARELWAQPEPKVEAKSKVLGLQSIGTTWSKLKGKMAVVVVTAEKPSW